MGRQLLRAELRQLFSFPADSKQQSLAGLADKDLQFKFGEQWSGDADDYTGVISFSGRQSPGLKQTEPLRTQDLPAECLWAE